MPVCTGASESVCVQIALPSWHHYIFKKAAHVAHFYEILLASNVIVMPQFSALRSHRIDSPRLVDCGWEGPHPGTVI